MRIGRGSEGMISAAPVLRGIGVIGERENRLENSSQRLANLIRLVVHVLQKVIQNDI